MLRAAVLVSSLLIGSGQPLEQEAAPARPDSEVARIPLRPLIGLIVFDVRMAGSEPVPFLLDSGASGTVIDSGFADRMELTRGSEQVGGGAAKGSRYALPHSKFLIHQPLLMGYQGRASDLEIQAREILRDREGVVQIYQQHTGRKAEEVAKDIDRDKWMTAEEALDYGLIDKIISNRKEIPK